MLLRLFTVLVSTCLAGEPEVVFDDPLKGTFGDGWEWLRENPKAWRIGERGLEIRVEPGLANTVKNALLHKAIDRSMGKYAVEVTIEFTAPPTQQYEQAGITWYQGGKPGFKLVHEFIDGKLYIIPGKKPAPEMWVQLRLIVSEDKFVAQFRQDPKTEFQTAAEGKLAPGKGEQISIQCYNGPASAEHWMRFSDFRIARLKD